MLTVPLAGVYIEVAEVPVGQKGLKHFIDGICNKINELQSFSCTNMVLVFLFKNGGLINNVVFFYFKLTNYEIAVIFRQPKLVK